MEPGNGSRHTERQVVCERVDGARPTVRSDTGSFEENLEGISTGLGPQPIIHAEQDDGTVIVYLTSATFGKIATKE